MKKIFALIVMMIFMFSIGNMAYGAQADISDKKASIQQKREEMKVKTVERQEYRVEIQALASQIKANQAEIKQLRAEARTALQAAVANIKELKDTETLTEDQLAKLKEAKAVLKDSRQELAESMGDVKTQKDVFKAARKGKDSEKAKESLAAIADIQKERVELLKGIIKDLKDLAAI